MYVIEEGMEANVTCTCPPSRSVSAGATPTKPRRLRCGDQVRIVHGPFREHLALYAGQAAHERVAVLLQLLGGQQRAELPADAVVPIEVVP
jgi:hypothetical protein